MRKFIALLLLALPTVLGFSIRAVAVGEKFTVQELVYMVTKDPIYTVNGAVGEAVLTWKNAPETSHQAGRYNSTYPSLPKKLVVPPMVVPPSSGNSYRVVGVGNSAFHSCAGIDTVLIPSDNRFRIEQNAFRYCTSLREVLGYEAEGSGNNWSVQEVHTGGFAASVDSLGENAFEACGFDTLDFTLPSPYRLSLSAGVFAGCPSLKALLAGSRLRRVGTNAFRASSELRFVEFDQQSLTAGVELSLEAGAFPASGSIEAIHLRYSQPPTLPAAGLGAVFGGLKETMKLYLPFRYLNIYEGWGGESVRDHIESSYAVHIPNPLKWVYAQRDTVMAYDLTYCGKPLNRKSAVVWQNELHDVAVVGVSCSPEQVCKLTLTSYQEGKTWIWGRFPDELTNGEGAQADSFRLTVRNPVEVVVKRKGTLIQNGDTLFIRVGEKDTLTTGINSYGLPTSDVPEMLWTELHKVKDKDGAGYIRRTVLPAAALSVIEPLGHDTVTYTVRAKAGSAALATFTVISPRMALTIAKRGNDNKKSDTIDVFRATILSVKDTTGTKYPYSWKILANTDTLGKPVADTLTLADKSLRVKARRPGTFRITVSTTALDSLPAIDTFTVLVRKPEIDVHIAVAKYDHLSSDGTTITVPVNHTDTLYANVKAFNKEVWKIKNIGDIQAMYGIPGSEALEPDEWLQDDPDKVAQYIGELNGSGLVKWGKKSNDKAFLFGDMDKDSIWVNPIDHKGGKTELYLEYTCFGRSRRDTVTVLALPVQVEIQAETQRGYMNRKDTLSVNIRYAEDYAAQGGTNATGGTAQPSVTINQPAVDTVLWKSLDERIARVNDAGIVSFLDTGTVSICAVTSKKASLSDYKGVGDTVVFRIYAPEIGIRFFRKADDGTVVPVTKDSPFTIKKGPDGQDSIWAEISIDGLLVTDSLALHWDCAAGFEDTIIVSTHNTDDRVGDTLHITGRKHKGGNAALWATTTLKYVSPWYNADPEVEPSILRRYTASSDTVEVEVWPLVIDIVDEQGVPVSDTHPLFEGMYTVKGHVVYRDDATPVVVDSVKWEVISPAKADIMTVEPKGEACTLRFTESGVVRLRATVMWKDSKGAFQEGVSDTVEFTVPVPNLELRLYSVRTGGFEIDKTYPPFYLRLYGSEKISVKLSRDNNPISPDDPLMAQLKGFVLDSTVVAIEKIELDGGVVRHDTFKVTALAHKEKATKVWVGDSLEISGKKYAINCVDTLRVEVAPIHLKITDDSPQNVAILFQNRP
ncbi:MAG: leucine-rich repeat domain-containing protein, partial [Tannerellaceae bacterium]|nr:leucine-rich repeat domain-containing protein [Tannerellaceae bacterium]